MGGVSIPQCTQLYLSLHAEVALNPSALEPPGTTPPSFHGILSNRGSKQVGSSHIKTHLINFESLLRHGDSNLTRSYYEIPELFLVVVMILFGLF